MKVDTECYKKIITRGKIFLSNLNVSSRNFATSLKRNLSIESTIMIIIKVIHEGNVRRITRSNLDELDIDDLKNTIQQLFQLDSDFTLHEQNNHNNSPLQTTQQLKHLAMRMNTDNEQNIVRISIRRKNSLLFENPLIHA
jgi:hypothetical protein